MAGVALVTGIVLVPVPQFPLGFFLRFGFDPHVVASAASPPAFNQFVRF